MLKQSSVLDTWRIIMQVKAEERPFLSRWTAVDVNKLCVIRTLWRPCSCQSFAGLLSAMEYDWISDGFDNFSIGNSNVSRVDSKPSKVSREKEGKRQFRVDWNLNATDLYLRETNPKNRKSSLEKNTLPWTFYLFMHIMRIFSSFKFLVSAQKCISLHDLFTAMNSYSNPAKKIHACNTCDMYWLGN